MIVLHVKLFFRLKKSTNYLFYFVTKSDRFKIYFKINSNILKTIQLYLTLFYENWQFITSLKREIF